MRIYETTTNTCLSRLPAEAEVLMLHYSSDISPHTGSSLRHNACVQYFFLSVFNIPKCDNCIN